MDTKLLGQRIKEARLAKKMTQTEVVGSFITRNMLSQIESGNAVPSMKTLTYLSKVLDLPPSVLLQDAESEDSSSPDLSSGKVLLTQVPEDAAAYFRAKEAYLAGDDKNAYQLLSSLPENSVLSDEIHALSARIALRHSEALFADHNYTEALEFAKIAESAASKGSYSSLEIKSQALLLLSDTAAKLAQAHKEA